MYYVPNIKEWGYSRHNQTKINDFMEAQSKLEETGNKKVSKHQESLNF